MNILGIETSCDETSAAIVSNGTKILSNVILSQIDLHAPYGGVVPEIASRSHVEFLPQVIEEALTESGLAWGDIDAVAATYGPGLSSSIMIGLSAAKALSLRLNKPFIGIDHIKAHIYSVFLGEDTPTLEETYPFAALVVSGGHTLFFRVDEDGEHLLGQTIDDAAGEAFDKAANLLGLSYPGGPVIDKISKEGNRKYVDFPRIKIKPGGQMLGGLDHEMCTSFSGLKTALMYYLKKNPLSQKSSSPLGGEDRGEGDISNSSATLEGGIPMPPHTADIAASFQEAIIDVLLDRAEKAVEGLDHFVVGGGVSLNSRLRERLTQMAESRGVKLLLAAPKHCGDNAAMIAGYAGAGKGITGEEAMTLDATPNINYATRN